VIPKPRFIFDSYKGDEVAPAADSGDTAELQIAAQKKHDNDYFSFFNSHENIILKPESNFKGLRTFLTHLPIDYYILLQQGYSKSEKMFQESNFIYCQNIPLLSH